MSDIEKDIFDTVPGARAFQRDQEKPNIKHNWLYSVVPSYPDERDNYGGIFLAGYCRQCRQAFTVRLKQRGTFGHVLIDKLDIPVWGCDPISET